MKTNCFYSESSETLDDFIKKIITYASSEVNGRRYTILSEKNQLSIFSDSVQIGTFSIENGEKYGTLQERKITFSSLELQPIILKIADSLTRDKTIKDFCHKKEIKEIFLEMPIEPPTEIVGQKEKWLTDFEDLENITKISDETFKKLTLNQLKAVFTGSPDLMIEVIYDQISYLVSAKKLFESKVLDISVFGKYQPTTVVCESEQLKLKIIDEGEKFQSLPLFLLSLQSQNNNFKNWPLLYLCIAYMESDYHSHTEMNETLFKIIADKEISSQDNIKMIFCCLPGLENNRKIMLELVKKDGLALEFASPELQKDPEIVLTAVQQNGLALQFACPTIKNNAAIIFQAILENPNASQYITLGSQASFLIGQLINIRNCIFSKEIQNIEQYMKYSQYVKDAVKKSPAIIKRILTLVEENPKALQFVPDHLEIAKIAVQKDGMALQYASPELQRNPDIVFQAILENPNASQYIEDSSQIKALIDIRNCIFSNKIEDIQQYSKYSNYVIKDAVKKSPAIIKRILILVGENPKALQFVPDHPEIAKIAVQKDGRALKYASPELRNDPTIVLPAVEQHGFALKYASPELQNDPTIVLAALQQDIHTLEFASPELRNDLRIVLPAVQKDGRALEFASPELRNDLRIVLPAVQKDGRALKFASPELRNDRTIVLPAVNQDGLALEFANPELQNDPTIVLPAVQQNGLALQYVSLALRNDRTIVLPAVQQNGWTLQYASPELRKDPEIVRLAVQKHGHALQYANPELQNDPTILLPAVQQNGDVLKFASPKFCRDLEIVLTAVQQDGRAFKYASPEFQKDPEIVRLAVQKDGRALQYANPELQNDPTIVLPAVQSYGLALEYASLALRNDPTIVLPALQQDIRALQYASPELRNDPEIVRAAVQQNGLALYFASPELQNDPTIVLLAVLQDGCALEFASPELRNDPTIVLPALQQDIRALQYASPKLRKDPKIVLPALQQDIRALQFASPELRNDHEIFSK